MLKKMKLTSKLLIPIITLSVIAIAGIIFLAASRMNNVTVNNAKLRAEETAFRYSNDAQATIELALDNARTLSEVLAMMKENEMTDRNLVIEVFKRVMMENDDFIGVWTVWEANAFDGQDHNFKDSPLSDESGRFIPYVFRDGEKIDTTFLVDYDKEGAGDYYLLAKRSKMETVIDPYEYEISGKQVLLITVSVPIIVDSKVLGVVGVDITNENFVEVLSKIKPFDTGYLSMISNNGTYLYHPTESNGVKVNEELWEFARQSIDSGSITEYINYSNSLKTNVYRLYVPIELGRSQDPWVVNINIPMNQVKKASRELTLYLIIVGVIAIIFLVFVVFFLIRSIIKPIKTLSTQVEKFGEGYLAIEFDQKGNDEIALMASSLNKMALSLKSSISAVNESAELIGSSSDTLNSISQTQDKTAKELAKQSQRVEGNIQNTSASIEEVTSGVEEVAASAQDVSKNSQELATQINETEESAKTGQKILENQGIMMEKVGIQNNQATDLVKTVAEKANNVQEIVNSISSISEQTNLLALNAAIEAARAGEAGKGFAVVADEIRKLAEESKRSSSNIAHILHEINETSNNANDAVTKTVELYQDLEKSSQEVVKSFDSIMKSINMINNSVESLTGVAEEQSASAEEMATAMDTSAKSINEISEEMEKMNDAVKMQKNATQEVAMASEKLNTLSEKLVDKIKYFKLQ